VDVGDLKDTNANGSETERQILCLPMMPRRNQLQNKAILDGSLPQQQQQLQQPWQPQQLQPQHVWLLIPVPGLPHGTGTTKLII